MPTAEKGIGLFHITEEAGTINGFASEVYFSLGSRLHYSVLVAPGTVLRCSSISSTCCETNALSQFTNFDARTLDSQLFMDPIAWLSKLQENSAENSFG